MLTWIHWKLAVPLGELLEYHGMFANVQVRNFQLQSVANSVWLRQVKDWIGFEKQPHSVPVYRMCCAVLPKSGNSSKIWAWKQDGKNTKRQKVKVTGPSSELRNSRWRSQHEKKENRVLRKSGLARYRTDEKLPHDLETRLVANYGCLKVAHIGQAGELLGYLMCRNLTMIWETLLPPVIRLEEVRSLMCQVLPPPPGSTSSCITGHGTITCHVHLWFLCWWLPTDACQLDTG